MKKLMIAAAIVCAAVVTQAATFSWTTSAKAYGLSATDYAALRAGTLKSGTYNAGTATSDYMGKETAITWTYVLTIMDADSQTYNTSGTPTYSSNKINVKNLSSDIVFKPEAGKNSYTYNISITGISGEYTLSSDTISGTWDLTTASALNLNTDAPSKWTVTAAPEPTSAMLLLLGMAGLALKRRRA